MLIVGFRKGSQPVKKLGAAITIGFSLKTILTGVTPEK